MADYDNKLITGAGLAHFKEKQDAYNATTYVAKETGKGLSTNDYTTAEKNKLAGIEAGAEVNIIEKIKLNDVDLTPDSERRINLGSIATSEALEQLTQRVTTAEGDIDTLESGKVDKETGKGLSTNDYTTAEKNKLAGIAAGAEVNVNPDWNATSGDAQILNKPTLGTAAAKDVTDFATAAQGALADTALQAANIATGSTNGTISVKGTDVSVKGLGSAAYTSSSDYASAAQGTKADNAMPISGGTFTGAVTLSGAPTSDLQPATKKYADDLIAGLGAVLKLKGTKATEADVKAITSAKVGDMWIVSADGTEWVCVEDISGTAKASAWERLGKVETTYTASNGIKLNGANFEHTNSVTASSAAKIWSFNWDAQGHITGTPTEVQICSTAEIDQMFA